MLTPTSTPHFSSACALQPVPSSEQRAEPMPEARSLPNLERRCKAGLRGQTSQELMLLISVVVVAIVGAAQLFVPLFQEGVLELALDVKALLSGTGGSRPDGGDTSEGGNDGGGGAGTSLPPPPSGHVPPSNEGDPDGAGDGDTDTGGDSGGSSSGEDGGSGEPDGDAEEGAEDDTEEDDTEEDDTEEESVCPYVYDEASNRWRDPETGQYVSYANAAAAGC